MHQNHNSFAGHRSLISIFQDVAWLTILFPTDSIEQQLYHQKQQSHIEIDIENHRQHNGAHTESEQHNTRNQTINESVLRTVFADINHRKHKRRGQNMLIYKKNATKTPYK